MVTEGFLCFTLKDQAPPESFQAPRKQATSTPSHPDPVLRKRRRRERQVEPVSLQARETSQAPPPPAWDT